MIYSVWNQGTGAFDYYEDGRVQNVLNVETPTHLTSRALGSTIEQAAWPLPAGARSIGQGPDPVGRIAVRGGGAALGSIGGGSSRGLAVAALAAAGLYLWHRSRR